MTTISAASGDIIYLSQSAPGSTVSYKINDGSFQSIGTWPVTLVNSDLSLSGYIKVNFETDITFNAGLGGTNCYFICGSTYIQIGNDQLNTNGTRTKITIDGIVNYPGLVKNGDSNTNGKNYITIKNIGVEVANGSTLVNGGGWIGQIYFSKRISNNSFVNCYSTGNISEAGGGIVGSYAGSYVGQITIYNCYSTGAIGLNAGGICGTYSGSSSGYIFVQSCFSTGNIGQYAGGIFGANTAFSDGNAISIYCYSTGDIVGSAAGGIYGIYVAESAGSCNTMSCYSTGNIVGNGSGGIFGGYAIFDTSDGRCSATNCFSLGIISGLNAGGIYGQYTNFNISFDASATATNCFMKSTGSIFGSSSRGTTTNCGSGNGSWTDSVVNTFLTGTPPSFTNIDLTWVRTDGPNTPYKLLNMGYSPYSRSLVTTFKESVTTGSSSSSALVSGHTFKIVTIDGNDPSTYTGITIDENTGAITIAATVFPATYIIMVYDYINPYAISELELVVTPSGNVIPSYCCPETVNANFPLYEIKESVKEYKGTNYDAFNYGKKVFNSYSDYIKYKMTRNYICQ